jgi:uracil-DNA glycosylase
VLRGTNGSTRSRIPAKDGWRPRRGSATVWLIASALRILQDRIASCRACPRLVRWRELVARDKVRRFAEHEYWGRPVAGFGDPKARIVIVGLAPAAHGANRTGRAFTGDRSGDFLFAALHRAGLANQPTSVSRDDGLRLEGVFITLALRCAPPANQPRPEELARCAPFFEGELALLGKATVILALGAIAWNASVDHRVRQGIQNGETKGGPRPKFRHGAEAYGAGGPSPAPCLLGSYHVSQQNTQTGRLTPSMFDSILRRADDLSRSHCAGSHCAGSHCAGSH